MLKVLMARCYLPEPKKIIPYSLPSTPLSCVGGELRKFWQIGEKRAHQKWKSFQKNDLPNYAQNRDRLDLDGTSKLFF